MPGAESQQHVEVIGFELHRLFRGGEPKKLEGWLVHGQGTEADFVAGEVGFNPLWEDWRVWARAPKKMPDGKYLERFYFFDTQPLRLQVATPTELFPPTVPIEGVYDLLEKVGQLILADPQDTPWADFAQALRSFYPDGPESVGQ